MEINERCRGLQSSSGLKVNQVDAVVGSNLGAF